MKVKQRFYEDIKCVFILLLLIRRIVMCLQFVFSNLENIFNGFTYFLFIINYQFFSFQGMYSITWQRHEGLPMEERMFPIRENYEREDGYFTAHVRCTSGAHADVSLDINEGPLASMMNTVPSIEGIKVEGSVLLVADQHVSSETEKETMAPQHPANEEHLLKMEETLDVGDVDKMTVKVEGEKDGIDSTEEKAEDVHQTEESMGQSESLVNSLSEKFTESEEKEIGLQREENAKSSSKKIEDEVKKSAQDDENIQEDITNEVNVNEIIAMTAPGNLISPMEEQSIETTKEAEREASLHPSESTEAATDSVTEQQDVPQSNTTPAEGPESEKSCEAPADTDSHPPTATSNTISLKAVNDAPAAKPRKRKATPKSPKPKEAKPPKKKKTPIAPVPIAAGLLDEDDEERPATFKLDKFSISLKDEKKKDADAQRIEKANAVALKEQSKQKPAEKPEKSPDSEAPKKVIPKVRKPPTKPKPAEKDEKTGNSSEQQPKPQPRSIMSMFKPAPPQKKLVTKEYINDKGEFVSEDVYE